MCVLLFIFGIKGGMCDVIVLIPDHCVSIYFIARVCHERLSDCMYASFPLGFEGEMWDSIVLVPEYCFSFYCFFIKKNHQHSWYFSNLNSKEQ